MTVLYQDLNELKLRDFIQLSNYYIIYLFTNYYLFITNYYLFIY